LKAEGFCYLSMAGSTKNISEWKVSVRRSMESIYGISWVILILLSFRRVNEKYIYIDGFYCHSLRRVIQNRKKNTYQQPQLGAGRLLNMNTKKVVGTAMFQKPAKTQTLVLWNSGDFQSQTVNLPEGTETS